MPRELHLDNFKFEPDLLLQLAKLFAKEEGTCLLFSGGNFETSRYSYLSLFPFDFIYLYEDRQWRVCNQSSNRHELTEKNPWDALKILMPLSYQHSYPEWVGFIAYEMGAYSDKEKTLSLDQGHFPYSYFQRSAVTIRVDHDKKEGSILIEDQAYYLLQEEQIKWVERLSNRREWDLLSQSLAYSKEGEQPRTQHSNMVVTPGMSKEEFISKVEQAKEWIGLGDIYQVNFSQSFKIKNNKDPFHIFLDLVHLNPAPFSAYFKLPEKVIVSSSPERFLKLEKDLLETRPIKGTIKRGKTAEEDKKNKETLMTSAKDNAELLMITDLMRNDLGKVSLPGSVRTVNLCVCESYTNVFHLLSIIQSRIQPNLNFVDIIRNCFPGGSVTGCPKLSAMEAIAKLEGRIRGIYTGSIGYIAGNGDFDFNIAIRTLVQQGSEIEVQLGGAIVADSNPDNEYLETLYKGESIFTALANL